MTSFTQSTRRTFLKTSALTGAALALPRFNIAQPGTPAGFRINVACIGIGHRGFYAVSELLKSGRVNIVATCDVDATLVEETHQKAAELGFPGFAKVPLYRDYREMLAAVGDRIDAVTISTPDHHHYPAAMMAMQRGKHVYLEKPLAHTVGEARALRSEARRRGVITQMGNQGRASEGIRLVREWTQAGVLGDVREVHTWSAPFPEEYFKRPASLPLAGVAPPKTLDWDLWLGPAESQPYHPLLAPRKWRGWWKYGNGMLGDWGCHTLDGPFWALDLGSPNSIEAEVSSIDGVLSPEWALVTYHFPARGQKPPITLRWFEGLDRKPPFPAAWDPAVPFPERGILLHGSVNTLYAPNGRSDSPRLLQNEAMEALKARPPARTIPRVVGGPVKEWLDAIQGSGPTPGSNFDYSAPLSEIVLLGALAVRTGRRIEWDGEAGRITNDPSLDELIGIHSRAGWRVAAG